MKKNSKILIQGVLAILVIGNVHASEKVSDISDQNSVAITIYNKDLALIKDQRGVKLDRGFNQLAFRGVSARMRPETAILRSLSNAKGFRVIEQNFDYDLLTPNKLLDKYVGNKVRIVTLNPATGKQKIETATVLSTQNGVVVKIGDRIEVNPKGRFIFDTIPKNLRDKPTLVTQLNSATAAKQQVELSYLSGGLSWKADYVAELNADDSQINLIGWVTLNNVSGTDYNKAKLQLIAGDVNQVQPAIQLRPRAVKMEMMAYADAARVQEESLFEYHLYSLDRPTSILNKQTKQVALLSANSVPVKKELVLNGASYYYHNRQGQIGNKLKVSVYVQLENKSKAGLGMPIPKGIVRVYKRDSQANVQFIGEDKIDHTPKNETIRLKLGEAFDVTANKKQTDFKVNKNVLGHAVTRESAFSIELKNAKAKAVSVLVREPIPGDWKILDESHQHKKLTSGLAEWRVEIPAENSVRLTYRVLIN